MWIKVLVILAFSAGYSAANENCNISPVFICIEKDFNPVFPNNGEELLTVCNALRSSTECLLNFSLACGGADDEISTLERTISYLDRNCQANSTVYEGVVSHIDCIKPIFSDEYDNCKKTDDVKAMKFFMYMVDLSERGIKEASDDDSNMIKCLDILYLDACSAAEVGMNCSSDARNAVLSILQNLDPRLTVCKKEIKDDMITLVNLFESSRK